MNRLFVALVVLLAGCSDLDGDGKRGARDCDDSNPAIFKDNPEVCDGLDNDCDGQIDEDVALVAYWDRDRDGFGDPEFARRVCELPEDGSLEAGDCDDTSPAIRPDADEICDQVDNDCDGEIDEGVTQPFYADADGDGYGTGDAVGTAMDCWPPAGFALEPNDCDDAQAVTHPDATELCDSVDNDCDGDVDEGLPRLELYIDADGDGSGDPNNPTAACGPSAGVVADARDCDDTDPLIGGLADEVPGNPIDEDCDGWLDEIDVDGFATPEDALAATPDGGVLQFGDGTWLVNLDATGRDVVIAGNGCEHTTLYGSLLGSVVQMDDGALIDATISGGSGTRYSVVQPEDGGGLFVPRGAVTVERACFERNSVSGRGGAIAVHAGGTLHVRDSGFADNDSQGAGGGIYGERVTLDVRRSRFHRNASYGFNGGAIALQGGWLDVESTAFAYNHADRGGSSIALYPTEDAGLRPEATDGRLLHITVHGGTSRGSFPSAVFQQGGALEVRRSIFTDNEGSATIYGDAESFDDVLLVPSIEWSDLAFAGNEDWDLRLYNTSNQPYFVWDRPAVRERPAFVRSDPTAPDLRLMADSPMRDQVPDERDRDGSIADLGAYGGPAAQGWDAPLQDADLDGLNDGYELRFGLPTTGDDAPLDPDGDGLTNLEEHDLGSDPHAVDTDDDGVDDLTESVAGLDPTDARDQVPVADAGGTRLGLVGLSMDIPSASFDPNGDPLAYAWVLTAPGGSLLTDVDDPAAPTATFTPDASGTYTLELTVDDGLRSSSHSITVRVSPGVHVPTDHPTLAEALAAIQSGHTIAVDPGVYDLDYEPNNRHFSIFGTGPGVVLRGNGADPLIRASGGSLALADLTMENGRNLGAGGAIEIEEAEFLELYRMHFRDNEAVNYGGAVWAYETDVVAEDFVAIGNRATRGAGLYVIDGGLDVKGCLIANSHVVEQGAAIWHDGSASAQPSIDGCAFVGNSSELGSIVYFTSSASKPVLSRTVFLDNTAQNGIWLQGMTLTGSGVVVQDNDFVGSFVTGSSWTAYLFGAQESGTGQLIAVSGWEADTPRDVADLRPAFWPRGGADLELHGRLGSSSHDRGWIDRTDADGSRADAGIGGIRPNDGRWRLDADVDGMSDGWEVWGGLDPTLDDAAGDLDGDGLDNLGEHEAGTHPGLADSDEDGLTDDEELTTGSDPLDSSDNRPVAEAGGPYIGTLTETATVDGSASSDPNADPLTYAWTFEMVPAGSALTDADLTDADTAIASFEPDERGRYVLQLVVSDGSAFSEPSLAQVDIGAIIRVPDDFATVDAAADAAVNGDTIEIGPGSWPTRLFHNGTSYTVQGAGIDQTFLVGKPGYPVVTVNQGGSLTLADLTLEKGTGNLGGAVRCEQTELFAYRVAMVDNIADRGGALYIDQCTATFEDVDMRRNQSVAAGGAVFGVGASTLVWTRGTLGENVAGATGGAFHIGLADLELHNLLIHHNRSATAGGAMYRFGTLPLVADHLTVIGNRAANGGGLYLNNAPVTISNSVFHANDDHQLEIVGSPNATLSNNGIWRPDFPLFSTNPGNLSNHPGAIVANPLLVQFFKDDPSTLEPHLRPASPMIDAGNDLDRDGSVGDLGHFGGPLAPDGWDYWLIDADGDLMSDGWELLYGLDPTIDDGNDDLDGDGIANLQEYDEGTRPDLIDTDGDGIDDNTEKGTGNDPTNPIDNRPTAVTTPDVAVDPGQPSTVDGRSSFDPNSDPLTYAWTLVSVPGRSALTQADLTGADTDEVMLTPDSPGAYVLELVVDDAFTSSLPALVTVFARGDVLVPEDYASVEEAVGATVSNYTVFIGAGMYTSHIDPAGKNLTLQGAGPGITWLDGARNGTVLTSVSGGTTTLEDLTVSGGFAPLGGGIYVEDGGLTLTNVHVQDNESARGAGIALDGATATLLGVRIVDNDSGARAGGMYVGPASLADLTQVLVAGNGAWTASGGGIEVDRAELLVSNAIFADNVAATTGGAISITGASNNRSDATLGHITVTHNLAGQKGSVIDMNYADVSLVHGVLVDNSGGQAIANGASAAAADYTQAWTWLHGNVPSNYGNLNPLPDAADGNIEQDPFLAQITADADWTNDVWALTPSSPARDSGDPAAPTDFDGSTADPGAYGGPDGSWIP